MPWKIFSDYTLSVLEAYVSIVLILLKKHAIIFKSRTNTFTVVPDLIL